MGADSAQGQIGCSDLGVRLAWDLVILKAEGHKLDLFYLIFIKGYKINDTCSKWGGAGE